MDVAKNNVVRDKLKLQFTDLMVSVFILMLFIISNICAQPDLINQFQKSLPKQHAEVQIKKSVSSVGPKNFKAISKLGQGSFGIVYLVEKLKIDAKGKVTPTNKFYALKLLAKKQIMGQNLVKYAKAERDVMTITTHPFSIGLKYAF